MPEKPSPLTTWCRLLRLPNLFTVPGDPLAGFMLATGGLLDWRVAGAMATSLLLYSAGLLLNDYFDRHVDALERPDRPIPSGAVSARTVLIAGSLFLVAGVVMARVAGGETAGIVAVVLAGAVLAYDGGLKLRRIVGPIVMGGCRASSVLLGPAFAGSLGTAMQVAVGWVPYEAMAFDWRFIGTKAAILAAVLAWAYITSVTVLASGEASDKKVGRKAYLPGIVLAVGGIAVLAWLHVDQERVPFWGVNWLGPHASGERLVDLAWLMLGALLASATVEAILAARHVRQDRLAVPPFIGRLIRVTISIQAAWCVWALGPCFILNLSLSALPGAVVAWLVVRCAARVASRRFYGS